MGFFIGMTVGIILGALMMCFVVGASISNRENEVYMEGHIAGYAEGYAAGQNDKERGTK